MINCSKKMINLLIAIEVKDALEFNPFYLISSIFPLLTVRSVINL